MDSHKVRQYTGTLTIAHFFKVHAQYRVFDEKGDCPYDNIPLTSHIAGKNLIDQFHIGFQLHLMKN